MTQPERIGGQVGESEEEGILVVVAAAAAAAEAIGLVDGIVGTVAVG